MTPQLTPIPLSENSRTILEERYLQPGETPEKRFWRVCEHVAAAESRFHGNVKAWTQAFYNMLSSLEFLPNSPTLRNAGSEHGGVLSACFVIPFEGDDLESIMEAERQAAWVQKYGGGTGFNFSTLRPENDPIRTTQKGACGPIRVLKHFDSLSETFTQGHGSFRPGANMGMLDISHPDVFRFIEAKADKKSIANFNISVVVTDAFMQALDGKSPWNYDDRISETLDDRYAWPLRFGDKIYRWVDARDLWQAIIEHAHTSGDPGVYYQDTAERANPTPKLGALRSTNPCGEVPLLAYEPCNLGSINLKAFVRPLN